MSNLGWLFYKDYFRGVDYTDLGNEANEELMRTKVQNLLTQSIILDDPEMLGNTHFTATTTYPGLLLGSGNAHELPDIKGQLILGFSFDYTSGLPVIPGSSIKGVLRSAFKYPEYIQELLKDSQIDINALETEIFENGDIFFDAVVVEVGGSNLLGDDYITPHKDPLKDPVPLRFVKVMPNVTFRFDFVLRSGLIEKHKKAELFQNILADLGLGAKTNVGYGKFDGFKKLLTPEELEAEKVEREESAYKKALESQDLLQLEQFKRDFPHSNKDVDGAITELKKRMEALRIERAYEELDKSNKKHVGSFIEKYRSHEAAQAFIRSLEETMNEPTVSIDINALETVNDAKKFKSVLESLTTITQDDHAYIESQAIRLYRSLKGKKQKNCFKEMQLARFVDSAFEASVKAKVEAK